MLTESILQDGRVAFDSCRVATLIRYEHQDVADAAWDNLLIVFRREFVNMLTDRGDVFF